MPTPMTESFHHHCVRCHSSHMVHSRHSKPWWTLPRGLQQELVLSWLPVLLQGWSFPAMVAKQPAWAISPQRSLSPSPTRQCPWGQVPTGLWET